MQDVSNEDWYEAIDTTKPKYTNNPETKLLHKLFAAESLRKNFKDKAPEEIAGLLGFDETEARLLI